MPHLHIARDEFNGRLYPCVQVDAKFPQKVDGQVTTIENKLKAGIVSSAVMNPGRKGTPGIKRGTEMYRVQ